ncbi:PREDICTED: interferon-inducible GTPase 1-like isoform X2 [Chinchilla lanigera]|nr:PREDICTED: interferon-inducible GTPase 1-like isoform X2 [Chinchilla lanigera]
MGQLFSNTPNEEHQDLVSSFKQFKDSNVKSKLISQEATSAIELHLTKGDIQGANAVITAALKEISDIPLNIAVTGESGSGKSSLVNTLRGVKHESKDAAPIGVCETTIERASYTHPNLPNVTIWDLPGIGTTNFPPKDYLKRVQFVEYDFFIIVSATRFKQNDIDLAEVIRMMGKNFYFVRTKVDSDLRNEKECKPSTFNENKVLQMIRKNCLDNFKKNGMIEPQIFLVSNNNLSKFDFPKLMDTLIKDVPAQKRHIFTLSLPNITEAAIERKRESLKKYIWLEAFKGGLQATLPALGMISVKDMKKLKASLNHFQLLFGVDDLSLKLLAKDLQVPVEQLKAIIKSPHLLEMENEETLMETFWGYVEKFFSVNGGLVATGLYFQKIFYLQLHFLDTVTEDAKVLLKQLYSRENSNLPCPTAADCNKI